MKNLFYLVIGLLLLTDLGVMGQSIEINPASSSSAIISSTSTDKGLLVPRMTDTQRNAIPSPATGLMVYQTNGTTGFYFWNGTTWTNLGGNGGTASELQKITEGSNTGWRILGRNAANYGDIGFSAIDLSRSTSASTSFGATGLDALATGFETTASGNLASAIGWNTTASGQGSTAMGIGTRATQYASTAIGNFTRATGIVSTANGDEVRAKSFGEFAIGSYNDTLTTVNSTTFAGDNNRIFTVGTGTSAARRTSFVVQQNGNVGIGASSPNAQLQLGNTIANRKVVLFEVANNDHQYYGLGINNQVFRYQVDNTISSHAFYAATSTTASTELMRITGTGNVGIGTTTPNAPLQFANTVANRKIVLFDGLNNDHQYFGLGINTSMLRYQVDGTASVHAFFSGATTSTSTELMRIQGNGNVGIGTTAPSEKLHVAGSVRIVDGTQAAGRVLTSDANGRGTWTTPAASGNSSELQKITEGSNTGWRILGRDAANHGDIGANALDLSRSTLASTTTGATGPDAFATGFVTTASGTNSTAMGNSTNALGMFSTAMGSGSIASGQSSTAIGNFSRATGVVSIAAGNEVRAKSFGELTVGSFNDTLTTVNSSTFAGDNNRIFTVGTGSSGSARRTSFVVQQNGNVGVGASAPNAQLQLGNTLTNRKVVLFEVANNDHQYYGLGINNQVFRYQVDNTISSHAFYAATSTTASNELMRITGTGNVGIGTTAPNAPLQFANIAANRKIVLFDGLNNDHQYFGFGINTSMLRYQVDGTASVHAFFSGATTSTSTELMRIQGNGNVGIGTTAPTEKLHVAGSVRIVDGTQAAGRVLTSDANGRGTWTTPAAGGNTSELQKITEGSNTGWRILGRDAANYGDIGSNALDFSRSITASTTRGATGIDAFATGNASTASGNASTALGLSTSASGTSSTAMGQTTIASGDGSTAMGISTRATQYASTAMGAASRATGVVSTAIGNELIAKSATEFVVGSFNDTLTTFNATAYAGDNNRTFTIGTGSSNSARRTSFVVQQNGNVGVGASSPNAQLQLGNTVANRKIVLFDGNNNDNQYFGLGINSSMFRYQVDGTGSVHAFFAGETAATSNELMRIQGNGYVSIGITAPTSNLMVGGTPGPTGLVTFNGLNYGSHFYLGATQDTYIRGGKIGSHVYLNDDALNGNVKIGGGIPTEKLDVTGNLKVNGNICYTGIIGACSDLRYKTNFSKIENPLNKVLSLNGLHYDWKVEEFKENNFTKDRQIGFIAQEIEEIFPEMVLTDAKGYKSVDYARLTPVLVEAIKELKTLNDELKGKNEKLEANSQKLEARLDKIEALLNR